MKALLVYPTHENLREVQQPYVKAGIDARVYPPRLTKDSEHVNQNCWNPAADVAESMGFAVVKAVCPHCKERVDCKLRGYLGQLANVKAADIALCTHKRVEYTDFADLMTGRTFVSVHENPMDLLRPRTDATERDLIQVQVVLERLMTAPNYLNWFGNALSVDDDGERYLDEELSRRKDRLYEFTRHTCLIIDDLVDSVQQATKTTNWTPRNSMRRPVGIERMLFNVTNALKCSFIGQPWRFVLAAAAGELMSSAIIVTKQRRRGQDDEELVKTAVGFRDNRPLRLATTWFNDATLSADTFANVLGTEVWDRTPGGRLELQKKAVQILRDITRRTSNGIFANIIRGTLADRPQFKRVGVICHRPHIEALRSLEPEFARRIVKSAYFGSGEERSSNAWHQECDVILVAGTPRLPPAAIATYLVQIGCVGAACRDAQWGTIKWETRSETGEFITVTARGYQDADWQRAQRDLVRSSIVQAVGRGRGILESGCEVIVLSTEECGLPISDAELRTLNGSSASILSVLRELTLENPKIYILRKASVSTPVIAQAARLSEPRTRALLNDLERRGHVIRVGERGGWRLSSQPGHDASGLEAAGSSEASSTDDDFCLPIRAGPSL